MLLGAFATAAWAASSKEEPASVKKPAKTAPSTKGAVGTNLGVALQAPGRGTAAAPLDSVRAVVTNAGANPVPRYRVELTIRPAGSSGVGKPLGDQKGSALAPGARRAHTFAGARVPSAGRYQICARVQARGDRSPANDEDCGALEVAAAPKPTQKEAAPSMEVRQGKPPASTARTPGTTTVTGPLTPQAMAARRNKYQALVRTRTEYSTRARSALEAAVARANEAAYGRSYHGTDCDDQRRDVYPGAAEICDGADNNCDGEVDEGQTILAYVDADGDGHGAPESGTDVCPDEFRSAQEDGEWLSMIGNDCDDADPDRWHGCE
jgi:hypothetical protein